MWQLWHWKGPDGKACGEVIWSYNKPQHMWDQHGQGTQPEPGAGIRPTVGPQEAAYLQALKVMAP